MDEPSSTAGSDGGPARFAPIVLFVYNRPEHTRRTLEALSANPEAAESDLHVFADGPKPAAPETERAAIEETRRIVGSRQWCQSVRLVAASENRGLAASIIDGVTEVTRRFGAAIVVEDDIHFSPGALRYFNDALRLYRSEERVHQISGFMVPAPFWARATGFLRVTASWGWATWDRAWRHYRNDAAALRDEVLARGRHGFDLDGASFHFDELEKNVDGRLKTWAVRWYASVYLRGGLALYPKRSLVRNAGFDGSGVHCEADASGIYDRMQIARETAIRPRSPEEDPVYLHALQRFHRGRYRYWTRTRFRDRLAGRMKSVMARAGRAFRSQ